MSIDQWLLTATAQLSRANIPSARLDALLIAEHTLKVSREWILAHGDNSTEQYIEQLNNYLAQRENHTPLAYIIGTKEFYGRTFRVTPKTLIPRPESEDIIHQLLALVEQARLKDDVTIADIGTGSGILAITAKLELPASTVVATDIDSSTLEVAKQNALLHKTQIQFYRANVLDLPGAVRPDLVLANLPYVPSGLITSEEITKEPKTALFSGGDGLDHYRTLWQQLVNINHKPTYIITESLQGQHEAIIALAKTTGYSLLRYRNLIQIFILDNS